MCVERVQRMMMAIFMGVILWAYTSMTYAWLGIVLNLFMIVMLTSWSLFNFCPSTKILEMFLPNCKFGGCGSKTEKTDA